jgi:hypothetical protein
MFPAPKADAGRARTRRTAKVSSTVEVLKEGMLVVEIFVVVLIFAMMG